LGSSVPEIFGAAGAKAFGALLKESVPHPVMKYCVIIPMIFDTTQYSDNPLEYINVKNANINGIIHVIMLFMDCCLASDVGTVDIFCSTHIVTPVNIAMM
jgi:hypothetical protein